MIRICWKILRKLCRLAACGLLLAIGLPTAHADSGTWQVIPIRLDFDQRARSGVVTIVNNSDDRISFSIDGREWRQDADGKDQYTETGDLLFFPQALTIGPREQRVIRAGIKVPAVSQEKTYRLFIKQEIPPEQRAGTTVAIAIRFGVPIFAKPVVEQVAGSLSEALLEEGAIKLGLRNTGNVHFRVAKIQISGTDRQGAEVFSRQLDGAYLLAGSARTFMTAVPEEVCPQLEEVDIQVTSERIHLGGKIHVDKARCLAP